MLYNKTQGKKVIEKVRFAKGFFGKFRGLMFERKKNFDYGLVFEFGSEKRIEASIHMMFVFFPIDAVYLDSQKKVVDIATVKPFSLNYTPKKKAGFLVELPVGSAKTVSIGDTLKWD